MKNNGFTLIEISIILIILAIGIVGAVRGSAVMDGYRLQATANDLTKNKSMVDQFFEKYKSLPGDMPDASSIWSGETNGNGNSVIDPSSEEFIAWKQLNLGEFSNFAGSGGTGSVVYPRVNVPESRLPPSVMRLWGSDSLTGGVSGTYYNFIEVVVANPAVGRGGAFKPVDAEIVDKKVDDGNPTTGIIRAQAGNTDASGTSIPSVYPCMNNNAYNLTNTGNIDGNATGTTSNKVRGCILRYLITKY